MKGAQILLALLIAAAPVYATAIRFDSEAEFLQNIEIPYLYDDFNQYTYGSLIAYYLVLDQHEYSTVLSAENKLYSGNGNMSTNHVDDVLVLDFSESPTPVTAVGGYFWPTDIEGSDLIGYTKISLSDGTVLENRDADYTNFLGFVSTDESGFQKLEISVLGRLDNPYSWPTVDDLYIGSAKNLVGGDDTPIPYPEPSSLLLLGTGICGIVMVMRRKKK